MLLFGFYNHIRVLSRILLLAVSLTFGSTYALAWTSTDINLPSAQEPGSTTIHPTKADVLDVTAGGLGFGAAADSFRLVSKPASGNLEVETLLVEFDVSSQNPSAEAGVMIRKSLEENSAFAFVSVDSGRELRFRWRTESGAAASFSLGDTLPPASAVWLRLQRSGSICSGFYSMDGINWTLVGSSAVALSGPLEAGLAVASGSSTSMVEADFERTLIVGNVPQRNSSGAGLRLWLRADSNVVYDENGRVSKWEDLSGFANDAYAEGGALSPNKPLIVHDSVGLKPGLRFDNNPYPSFVERRYLRVNHHETLMPARISLFMVARLPTSLDPEAPNPNATAGLLSKGNGSSGYSLRFVTAGYPRFMIPSSEKTWSSYTWSSTPPAQNYLFEAVFDQTGGALPGLRLFINGQQAPGTVTQRSSPITANTFPLFIGQFAGSPNATNPSTSSVHPFSGDIAEVLVFNDAVSEIRRREIEAYFKSKYQITAMPDPPVPPPVVNLQPGVYSSAQTLVVTASPGSLIWFRVNGGAWQLYTGPVSLGDGVTSITVKAEKQGHASSEEVEVPVIIDESTSLIAKNGLQLWLRADSGLTLGPDDKVLQWRSLVEPFLTAASGTSNERRPVLNAPGGAHPSRPALSFDADWLRVLNTTGNPLAVNKHTLVAVAKPSPSLALNDPVLLSRMNDTSGYRLALNKAQTNAPWRLHSHLRRSSTENTQTYTSEQTPVTLNAWSALLSRYDHQQVQLRVNGGLLGSRNLAWSIGSNSNALFIGAAAQSSNVPTRPFLGDIAEILVYDRELSEYEMRELEAYLIQRYEIPNAAPVANLVVSPEPGIYPPGTAVALSSSDNATITYTLNGGESQTYNNQIHLNEENAIIREDGLLCYTIQVSAEKPGFVSTTRELRYYVDPGIAGWPRDNLRLWLRADVGVELDANPSSPRVVRWEDQSGSGVHLAAPTNDVRPALQIPENGLPSIAFGETVLSALLPETPEAAQAAYASSATGQATVLVVAKNNASQDNAALLEIKSTSNNSLGMALRLRSETVGETTGVSAQSRFNGSSLKALSGSNPFLLPQGFNLFRQSTNTAIGNTQGLRFHQLEVNRSASAMQSNFAHVTGSPNVFVLGCGFESGNFTNPFKGELAEMLVFNRVLTTSELAEAEAYLARRHNLNVGNRVPLPVLPSPLAVPRSGTWAPGTSVTLSHPVTGAAISFRYGLVANPSELEALPWQDYHNPVQLNAPGHYFFQAKASKPGYTAGEDISFSVKIDASIAGLPRKDMVLWLAADRSAVTVPESNPPLVSHWLDESGQANHATPVHVSNTANYPRLVSSQEIVYNEMVEGQPLPALALDFVVAETADCRLRVLDNADFAHSNMTVFTVSRTRNLSSQRILLRRTATTSHNTSLGGWALSYNGSTETGKGHLTQISFGPTTGLPDSFNRITFANTNAAKTKPHLITALTGNNLRVLPNQQRNGEAELATPWFPDAAQIGDDLYIGGSHDNTTRFNGEIAEILIYKRHLPPSEITAVQNYLLTKYRFDWQPSLPAPTISPNGGAYRTAQTITVTPAAGTTVHYKEDGDLKSSTSTVQIALPAGPNGGVNTKTITAWSEKTGYSASPQVHAFFAVDPLADLIPNDSNGAQLKLWLRGDSALTDIDNKVTHWLDLSRNAHHLTKPTTPNTVGAPSRIWLYPESPFKSWPIIAFSSTEKTSLAGDHPGLNSEAVSIFAILSGPKVTGTAARIIAQKYTGGEFPSGYSLRRTFNSTNSTNSTNSSSRFAFNTSSVGSFADTTSDTWPAVLVGGVQGTNGRKLFFQADVKTSSASPTDVLPSGNPFQVGGNGASNNFDGLIADIWVFSGELTQREINQLGVYAHERYGVDSNKQVPAVTANYLGGTFSAPVGVTLSCPLPGVTFHYELGAVDATEVPDPGPASPVFTGAWPNEHIVVDGRFRILKARAVKAGYIDSEVSAWTFHIDPDKTIVRDGLVAWLRADRGVNTDQNDRVSLWLDQTGLGNDAASPNVDTRPLLVPVTGSAGSDSFQAVRFNPQGSTLPYGLRIPHPQRFPNADSPHFAHMSVIAVVRKFGSNNGILVKKGGFWLRQLVDGATTLARVRTNDKTTSIPIRPGEFEVITGSYDQMRRLISNSETIKIANASFALTQDTKPIFIGSTVSTNSSANFQGELAEIYIYNRALSEAERHHMESHLKNQYSIITPAALALSVPRIVPGPPNQSGLLAQHDLAEPVHVTISAPAGAAIYYTTDVTQAASPSTDWTLYTRPIPVYYSTAIYAFCRREGAQAAQSPVTGTAYELDPVKYPAPQEDANDTTPPVISLEQPANAIPIINP